MAEIKIYGNLKNETPGGYVATTDQVYDSTEQKPQNAINSELKEKVTVIDAREGYVVCDTVADSPLKVISIPGFVLSTGTRLLVKFTYANTNATPTLNINNTGEKEIYYSGSAVSNNNSWSANEVVDLYYDGVRYQLIPQLDVNKEIFVKGEGVDSVKHKDSTNTTEGANAVALGEYNSASGTDSFVHGKVNEAIGNKSHAEGNATRAKGDVSHAEGSVTISNGGVSHSEGYGTVAHDMSHSEGIGTIVLKINPLNDSDPIYKVISGVDTLSNILKGFFIATVISDDNINIHKTSCALITNIEIKEENAELGITSEDAGIYITTDVNLLTDPSSETKAYILVNSAFTPGSHIEGWYNVSATFNGLKSFINTYIQDVFDKVLIHKIYGGHVEGIGNIIGGKYSHAEGALNATNNAIVHIEGKGNIANADNQHVEGKFNEPDDTAAHIIGNGTDNEHRSNAASFDWNGNLKIGGNLKDSKGNIIDTTKIVPVSDHSGDGSDNTKIYLPTAESEKETYEGLIEDEEVIGKSVNDINKELIDHANNSSLHKTFKDSELIESANENIAILQKHIFNGHEYVDLNLPSGTLWATKNIGAESTFDAGSHFMWGDAKQRADKSEFVMTDCLYTIDGTTFSDKYKNVTSPNPNRPIGVGLDIDDDPANVIWRGMWRVPTFAQIEELFTENYIQHYSDALGSWFRISNGKSSDYKYLMQLPASSYYVDNTEVQDINTIYMMYRDIEGTATMKIAKIERSGSVYSVTKESVPIWTGVIIRPVLN